MTVNAVTPKKDKQHREQGIERRSSWSSWSPISPRRVFSSLASPREQREAPPRIQPYVARGLVISNTNDVTSRDMITALYNSQIPERISNIEADNIVVRKIIRNYHSNAI